MNEQLKSCIQEFRKAIAAAEDPSEIGYLAPPSRHQTFPEQVPPSYQAFLREADGAVCGVVHLYESDGLLQRQAVTRTLPGGKQKWFCIGDADESPLVVNIAENTVHCLDSEDGFTPGESFGEVDYFILEDVFGDGYAEFVDDPEEDPWHRLVRSQTRFH
jgi:hypothetical protein